MFLAVCVLLLGLSLCTANPEVVKKDAIAAKMTSNYFDIIVDIRSPSEYEKGHAKNAINLPMPTAIEKLKGCEDKKIAVHCFRGNDRARPFAIQLAASGYKHVYDIGGFRDFRDDVPTATGAWDGKLPSCAHGGTQLSYIKSKVRLQGISTSQFDTSTRRKFTQVVAKSIGKICGDGKHACDSSSVTITSLTGNSRRSSSTEINFAVKTTTSSVSKGIATLGSYMSSATFKSDLRATGGNLAHLSSTSVVDAPRAASVNPVPHSAPAAPKAPPAPIAKDGVLVVKPVDVASQVDKFDIIVDVRSPVEYGKGHIPGAINLPGYRAVEELKGCEKSKIGVYCWTGPDRATPLAQALARAGFSNVYDLGGLQFMDGLVTETGSWNGVYPTCAAGAGEESKSWGLCLLLIAGIVLFVLGFLFSVVGVSYWLFWRAGAPPVQVETSAQGVPMNDVDIEKAQAQGKMAVTMLPVMPGACPAKDSAMPPVAAVAVAEDATHSSSAPVVAVEAVQVAPVHATEAKDEQV